MKIINECNYVPIGLSYMSPREILSMGIYILKLRIPFLWKTKHSYEYMKNKKHYSYVYFSTKLSKLCFFRWEIKR